MILPQSRAGKSEFVLEPDEPGDLYLQEFEPRRVHSEAPGVPSCGKKNLPVLMQITKAVEGTARGEAGSDNSSSCDTRLRIKPSVTPW